MTASDSLPTPQRQRKLTSQKLSQLRQFLDAPAAAANGGTKAAAAAPRASARSFTTDAVAQYLYSKAPVEFLEQHDVEDLAAVAKRAAETIQSYLDKPREVHIAREDRLGASRLWIALSDRPFIVTSLTEIVRYIGGQITAFLHPILVHEGARISLSYLEIERLSPADLDQLVEAVRAGLQDLILATDDFTSMLVRSETVARVLENSTFRASLPLADRREVAEFLRWLSDGNFIFLGHAEWQVDSSGKFHSKPTSHLGIFKTTHPYRQKLLEETRADADALVQTAEGVVVVKTSVPAPVHRNIRSIDIVVPELSAEGVMIAAHCFVGLFTSKALAQESSSVPLVRRKVQRLVDAEEVHHNSHDYKYIVDIVDGLPKDEALRLSVEHLQEVIYTVMGVRNRHDTRVSIRPDQGNRGVSALVVMPRDRFNTQLRVRLQRRVEEALGAMPGSSEYYLDRSAKPLSRFVFYVPVDTSRLTDLQLRDLEKEIAAISLSWGDLLRLELIGSQSFEAPRAVLKKYADFLSDDYQALTTPREAVQDIEAMERVSAEKPLDVRLNHVKGSELATVIVTTRLSELTLSRALPLMENCGLEVMSERSFRIELPGGERALIYRFTVRATQDTSLDGERFAHVAAPGLVLLLQDQAENDVLNSLMLRGGLDLRAISVLRSYACLLFQVNPFTSKRAIFEALASVPNAAVQLWTMFDCRFRVPDTRTIERRTRESAAIHELFKDELRTIKDLVHDRILRALAELVLNTVRTNFFTTSPTLAFKIHSAKVEIMPSPKPLFELFVRSQSVEGCHLRSSKVARGGIRWSERNDDYRREVLGLMKTQKTKNAVIVPEGAKGGFIVRQKPKDSSELFKTVSAAYEEYIRACLSVADNKVGGEVKHPENVVCFDEPDPYFVVAADKGTATFSDLANRIAVEGYDFWFGDAFASGGSQGYDHKLYGITAKGAWECVKRHFNDMGKDIQAEPFTVVGIGDMSGDVFGNGLILSDRAKLIAAFDHRHVFVDPDPDPAVSFRERERMFRLPRSQWTDYDAKLLSRGGAIYGRFDKEISLSPEAFQALGLPEDFPRPCTAEQLIQGILKAPVDLLWNGGIGTYVKSSSETHAEVNDSSNDRVRVSANELRAKVIGEGGNLGFTQSARIEFASLGGRLNTDAIDNSGGVDLSDHEVNIKILFAEIMRSGRLSREDRDKLLREMANEVCESVLDHNRSHALLLTVASARSKVHVSYFQSLLRHLSKLGFVDRDLEKLPDDEEIQERAGAGLGFYRPELAVCTAVVKMWVKSNLLKSAILEDPLLKRDLLEYFPKVLHARYEQDIVGHPLAKNIIATQVTNSLVDSVGITFIHRMCSMHSVDPITVIKCALAATEILQVEHVRKACKYLDTPHTNAKFIELWLRAGSALQEATSWLINCHGHTLTLAQMVDRYRAPYAKLMDDPRCLFVSVAALHGAIDDLGAPSLDQFSRNSLACGGITLELFEVMWTAQQTNRSVQDIASVYQLVVRELQLDKLLRGGIELLGATKWDEELSVQALQEIRRGISLITARTIESGESAAHRQGFVRALPRFDQMAAVAEELQGQKSTSTAAVAVFARQLNTFLSETK